MTSFLSKSDFAEQICLQTRPEKFNRLSSLLEHKCISEISDKESVTTGKQKKIKLLVAGGNMMKYEFANGHAFYQFLDDAQVLGLVAVEAQKDPKNDEQEKSNEEEAIEQKGFIVTHYDDLYESLTYQLVDYCCLDRWVPKDQDLEEKDIDTIHAIPSQAKLWKPTEESKTIGLRYARGKWLRLLFRYSWEFDILMVICGYSIHALGLTEETTSNANSTEEGEEGNCKYNLIYRYDRLEEKNYRIVLSSDIDRLTNWIDSRNLRAQKLAQDKPAPQERRVSSTKSVLQSMQLFVSFVGSSPYTFKKNWKYVHLLFVLSLTTLYKWNKKESLHIKEKSWSR
ncbi:hypothetical protein RFI_15263 [Reticulomyxa filosa]|uniref:Uncharacterized protein n=1 Tax=Reticulomyxa filosa TaxID=46433 RepID=X6N877_RETFI|nr:hypothetical protein RFI_15263 [Reticulomyxa filosa]|eukprot:ETO21939.1 hypothetical protein RFI_15263 [Reticulomyxa filosa]